jgi:hypothetical protein
MSIRPKIATFGNAVRWLTCLACIAVAQIGPAGAQVGNDGMVDETSCDGLALSWMPAPPLSSNAAAPAVIFVPGRGAFDRNGNTPDLMAATTLFLATDLREAGISSVRFDKRGVGGSTIGNGKPWDRSTIAEEANDIRCLIRWLRQTRGPSQVTLAGFDDGGIVAALAAMTAKVDGIVMLPVMQGTADEMVEDMRREGLAAPAAREIEQAVAARLKGATADYAHPILYRPVDVIVRRAKAMRPPFDRLGLVARLGVPLLVIGAGWDFESSQTKLRRFAESARRATTFFVPDMNNLLRPYTMECPDSCQRARNPTGSPLERSAVVAIAAFVCGNAVTGAKTCREPTSFEPERTH